MVHQLQLRIEEQEQKARWLQNLTGLRKRKEAYTRTQFLDPSLRDLGWFFIPEQNLPKATANVTIRFLTYEPGCF